MASARAAHVPTLDRPVRPDPLSQCNGFLAAARFGYHHKLRVGGQHMPHRLPKRGMIIYHQNAPLPLSGHLPPRNLNVNLRWHLQQGAIS